MLFLIYEESRNNFMNSYFSSSRYYSLLQFEEFEWEIECTKDYINKLGNTVVENFPFILLLFPHDFLLFFCFKVEMGLYLFAILEETRLAVTSLFSLNLCDYNVLTNIFCLFSFLLLFWCRFKLDLSFWKLILSIFFASLVD